MTSLAAKLHSGRHSGATLINALEPGWYLDMFAFAPPEGFIVQYIDGAPGFVMHFDLSTTVDHRLKKWLAPLAAIMPRPLTLFIGTTVSEYAPLPASASTGHLAARALARVESTRAAAVIVKDLPLNSPLLSPEENSRCEERLREFAARGFEIVSGEALAYVPIDFSSTENFLSRMPSGRRKDIARKLKKRRHVRIDERTPGLDHFASATVDRIYELYLQVYRQSAIHFDCLSREFFEQILNFGQEEARVFLYYHRDQLVAFNYCLLTRGFLVDKYIGFDYTVSRDLNLYFVSWFHNLEYCLQHSLTVFVAGWSDPEIKARLGAKFTFTHHAVYFKNPLLRWLLRRFKGVFEADKNAVYGD